jgi:hypothetical protein
MEQLGWIVIRAILTPVEENKQQKKIDQWERPPN